MAHDWLDELLEGTKELETPRQYWLWSGLCAVSAVLKRNVYLNRFSHYLYPNIYVFLIGRSGIRKGPAVSLAAKLAEAVRNTRVMTGRCSIQGLTKEMGTARTQEGGPMLDEACAFLAAGEFAAALVADPQALTTLTDLFDAHYHVKWKNTLVGREGEILERPYLTSLFASNKVNISDLIQDKEILGGFIGRTFIVNATKKNKKNSLIEAPEGLINEAKAAEALKYFATLRGEFHWRADSKKYFDEWYHALKDENDDDPTGTTARFDTNVLKVAMLLSMTRYHEMHLNIEDIKDAIDLVSTCINDMNAVFMPGKGTETDMGKVIQVILTELLSHEDGEVTRQMLMSRHWGLLHRDTIDPAIETLVQAGIVKVRAEGTKAAYIYYQMTPEGKASILQIERSIEKEREKGNQ